VILDPVNDRQCLDQLVARARELAQTRLAYDVAARLRTPAGVVRYLQSLQQTDDDGTERIQVIACDVRQRLRFLPPDPNCIERTLAAMVLREILDPKTERVAISIDEPERHTGLIERAPGGDWEAVDLFPRRNAAGRRRRPRNADDDEQQVARIILKQLGPVTLAMLGARDLVASDNWLQFGIQGSPKKITKVRITLAPDDTYTVEFYRGRGVNIEQAAAYESVYVDSLHDLIESETGLYTRMVGRRQAPRARGRHAGRNSTVQDVLGYVHPVGSAVLGAFGLGGVANEAGHLEQQQGWLRRSPPPAGPAPSVAQYARPGAARTQPAGLRAPPATSAPWQAQQRDPELAAVGRPPLSPKPESGGSDHGDEDSTQTASRASQYAAADDEGARAGAYGSATPATAAPQRRLFF
jgi:hypothetical protein